MKKEELSEDELLEQVTSTEYKYGFTTNIDSDTIPKGLSEDVVRIISKKKEEPKLDVRISIKSIPSLARNGGTRLGKRKLSKA